MDPDLWSRRVGTDEDEWCGGLSEGGRERAVMARLGGSASEATEGAEGTVCVNAVTKRRMSLWGRRPVHRVLINLQQQGRLRLLHWLAQGVLHVPRVPWKDWHISLEELHLTVGNGRGGQLSCNVFPARPGPPALRSHGVTWYGWCSSWETDGSCWARRRRCAVPVIWARRPRGSAPVCPVVEFSTRRSISSAAWRKSKVTSACRQPAWSWHCPGHHPSWRPLVTPGPSTTGF